MMPRYEVRRRIEDVVVVEAENVQAAYDAVRNSTTDRWEIVVDDLIDAVELVRCAGCGCDLERHDSENTHEIDGQFFGTWHECACCPCSRCR